MKRFVPLFLAALVAACSFVPTVHAMKLKAVDMNFAQNRAANPGAGRADSATARALGSATPTAHDTTAALDLRQFLVPLDAQDGTTTVDSLSWLRVDFYPSASTPTVAADTVFFSIQVSADGVGGWVTPTALANTDPAGDAGAGKTVYTLEQGTANTFFWVIKQQVLLGSIFQPVLSSATAPTWLQLYGWPYMRFIFQSDRTGRYDCKVTGFVSDEDHD